MSDGNGTFVDVNDGSVEDVDYGWVAGKQLFGDTWTAALGTIEQQKAELTTALEEMDELMITQLPEGYRDVLDNVEIDAVDTITDTGRPVKPILNLPDEWPDAGDIPILGYLRPIPQQDLTYTAPTVPADPGGGLNWTASAYTSTILDPFFNAIYNGIVNGGTGLADAVEDAMIYRARARLKTVNDENWQKGIDAASTSGFGFPGGAAAAVLTTMANIRADQEENLDNDILKIQADLAQVNTHFMLDKGLALEQLFRQFHNDNQNRSLDAQKAIAQYVLDKYRAAVEIYVAQWEGVKAEIQAKIAVVDLVLKENQMMFEKFKAEMGAYTAEIDLVAKKISAIVEGYRGEVDGYRAEIDERAAWWRALTEEQKVKVEANRLEMEKAIAQVKAFIDGTLSLNGLRGELAKAKGGLLAQVLASCLGAINTSFSINHSGSESRSESTNFSATISESKNYEMS